MASSTLLFLLLNKKGFSFMEAEPLLVEKYPFISQNSNSGRFLPLL
jgi:hypothetical protein